MRTDIDAAMAKLAARQHGVFTLTQCTDVAGYTKLAARRVAAGRWMHVTPSTFAFAHANLSWESKAHAAVLSTPGCVVSGRAAMRIFGVGPFGRVPVEVLAAFGSNARGHGYIVHRCRHFAAIASVVVDGIPVLSPPEALADLSRTESRLFVQRLAEESIVARLVSIEEVAAVARRRVLDGCPGGERLDRVVDDIAGDAVPESELERRLQRLLSASPGLPPVVRQLAMPWWSHGEGRVDFALPAWKLIVECDGRRWHSRENDFERDRVRDNQATVNGWRVLRFSYRAITGDAQACLDSIKAAGALAA